MSNPLDHDEQDRALRTIGSGCAYLVFVLAVLVTIAVAVLVWRLVF